jgi:hypothetical protein
VRILRIRRGFVTNSSAANEYLSPSASQPGTVSPTGKPFSITAGISASAPPATATASSSNALGIGLAFAAVVLLFVVDRVGRLALARRRSRRLSPATSGAAAATPARGGRRGLTRRRVLLGGAALAGLLVGIWLLRGGGASRVTVECRPIGDAVRCTASRTGLPRSGWVCWELELACANGVRSQASWCAELPARGTAERVFNRSDFDWHINHCDRVVGHKVARPHE